MYWLPYIQTASRNLWHTKQTLCGPAKTMLGWHGSAMTWLSEGKQPLPVSHQPHNLYPLFCGVCEDSDTLGTLLYFHPYLKGVRSAGGPGSRGKGPSEGHIEGGAEFGPRGQPDPLPSPPWGDGQQQQSGKSAGCLIVTAALTHGAVIHMFAAAAEEPTQCWSACSEARSLESYSPPVSSPRGGTCPY